MPGRGEWVGEFGCAVALSSHRFTPFVIGERVPRTISRPPEALLVTTDDNIRHREKRGLKADVEFRAEFDPEAFRCIGAKSVSRQ